MLKRIEYVLIGLLVVAGIASGLYRFALEGLWGLPAWAWMILTAPYLLLVVSMWPWNPYKAKEAEDGTSKKRLEYE